MKWLSKKNENGEVSYWQTISDILSSLFLLILLICLLLALYIIRIPEDHEKDPDPGKYTDRGGAYSGGHYGDEDTGNDRGGSGHRYTYSPTLMPTVTPHPESGGGGGSGGYYSHTEPGWGDYEGTEKAAVYVRMTDAETGKIIRESGIVFDLEYPGGEQEILSVYYPERVSFRQYETTDLGTFYLPEKVRLGEHILKEKNEPTGYDTAEAIRFSVDRAYEWEDPFIVNAALFPSRNVIRIRQTDASTGAPLPGGEYTVTAAEDIITADGTLRYHEGESVGSILCDENGVGTSPELYLGEYKVTQLSPPEFYAMSSDVLPVTVNKKQNGEQPDPVEFPCEQTVFRLKLTDELYEKQPLADVPFEFRTEGAAEGQLLTTDSSGTVTLVGLAKNSSFRLRQISVPGLYNISGDEITFSVDDKGLIDGKTADERRITNRLLRTTVLIRDRLLQIPLSDLSVSLFDSAGRHIASWSTTGGPRELNGLKPGSYTLKITGISDALSVTVTDTEQIQEYDFRILTVTDIIGLCAVCLVSAGGIALAVILLLRKRTKAGQKVR